MSHTHTEELVDSVNRLSVHLSVVHQLEGTSGIRDMERLTEMHNLAHSQDPVPMLIGGVPVRVHPIIGAAVQAFREAERAQWLAERKGDELLAWMAQISKECSAEDKEVYFNLTQGIMAEYEEKRAKHYGSKS